MVVRLEIDRARLAVVDDGALRVGRLHRVGERRVPSARVPRPRYPLGRERVADGLRRLRRQRVLRRVGEAQVASRCRRHGRRLVPRGARVDDVAVRGDAAVEQQQVAVERRGGRARTPLQPAALVDLRAQAGRRGFVARRARADQPLVVDERVAVGRHEEVVGEHVVARPLPHRQLRAVVVRHHEAARVGHRGEAVVAPAVDLLEVLVVPVHGAAHPLRQRQVERRRVEAERPVRQPVRKRRVGVLAAPRGRQLGSGVPSRSTCVYSAGVAWAMPLAPGNSP